MQQYFNIKITQCGPQLHTMATDRATTENQYYQFIAKSKHTLLIKLQL